jgi:hypothetical protein
MGGMCQSLAVQQLHFSAVSLIRGEAFPLIMRKIRASVGAATATSLCAKKCQQHQGMIVILQRHKQSDAPHSHKKRGWLIPDVLNLRVPCPSWFLRV